MIGMRRYIKNIKYIFFVITFHLLKMFVDEGRRTLNEGETSCHKNIFSLSIFRARQIIFKQWTPTYGMKSYAVRESTLEGNY